MKKTESTGFTSLVSMLSILFAFVIVCALCVTLLVKLGVMNVDWLTPARATEGQKSQTTPSDGGVSGELGEITLDETTVRRVLSELPFFDTFYAKIYATYIGNGPDGIFKTEAYDVYRRGDKYKIVTYDSHMNKIRTLICDGKQVLVKDETNGDASTFPVSDAFSFAAEAPIPDFSIFKTKKYEVEKYYLAGEEYVFVCTLTEMNITDEVRVAAETGVVTMFKSSQNGREFYDYTLYTFDTDYSFAVGEFDIS